MSPLFWRIDCGRRCAAGLDTDNTDRIESTAPLHDVTGAWCDWMEGAGAGLVLVRPDHYVFGSAASPDAAGKLLSTLAARLCLS